FDGLISRNTAPGYQGSWGNLGIYTYIQFPKGYNAIQFQKTLDDIVTEHVTPIFEPLGLVMNYELQKLSSIHLYSQIAGEDEGGGSILYVYIFSAIAAFMLIIASINYMNLTTARSFRRAKEVGIRKVMGSVRGQLITQFITESVLVTLIAMLVSLLGVYLLLPIFNQIAQKGIEFPQLFELELMGILLGIILFIGLLAGSYPAFYLSKFRPVQVLKGRLVTKGGNTNIRKALVITQFSISIFMLISTLIVNDQLRYLINKELGFNKEQVLILELINDDLRENFSTFRNRLLQLPDVKNVSTASSSPGNNNGVNKVIFQVESNEGEMLEKGVNFFSADYDFVSTLRMDIVEGRDFSREIVSDTVAAVLVNESMVKRMSWQDPLGKKFIIPFGDTAVTKRVVGVIKDYHQSSLYNEISPIMIFYDKANYFSLVKLNSNNIQETVSSIENEWKVVFPNQPFEYKFMDEDFNAQYASDEKRRTIFSIFSAITIIIASLGLLGLTSFTTEQRTKEIGIRKVLGANATSIVFLVSKEFLILVLIATGIALPTSYYFMSNWLEAFVYKIDINREFFTFILAAGLALIITLITVGYHTTKAALANPVDSLKDE
ncbi:MAG: FtsX-like permease family protein, partial [Bacteroidota bacterium]